MGMLASHSEKVIKVRDLGLAAYLLGQGFHAALTDDGQSYKGRPLAAWDFDPSDLVSAQIELYEKGLAKVEPKTYQNSLTITRRALYDFLGIG